jgi:ribosome biogenesis protein MAK21
MTKEELLAEIKALGGDEADLDLIDIVSDDDEGYVAKDAKATVDKKFKDELAAFSKQLGLADHAPSEASEDEEEEQHQEDEEEEEEEDEEEDAEQDDDGPQDDLGDHVGGGKIANLVRTFPQDTVGDPPLTS